MSKYEWERGSIIIPAASWVAFRKGLIEAWNAEQQRVFALAVEMRAKVEAAAKGKRGFDRAAWLCGAMRAGQWGDNGESARDDDYHAVLVLLGLGGTADAKKTHAPKKKDLKILPTSRGARLVIGEADIGLVDETRTVHWSVGENNHACDTARSLPMARALFAALDRIEWTRGSGGKIIGNDEYHRDRDGEGGGGHYVTSEYGPHVKKQRSAVAW